ncbi:MAG: HAMP domain-containing histidine kinase [Ignavibacteriales bacterium]|nr:HAMP domain-containing histidine kinase [Ignavibacteriales bacterium]MCB9258644.1 HAMP domain-containing histidine kinase [Ignavibacteriales bacterium]
MELKNLETNTSTKNMSDNLSVKEKFFSKISHDLRGSFTSILGFSDILNDPNEELTRTEISDFVTRIGKQSQDSFELLVNFINWLKLENFNSGLTKEKLELLDLIYSIQNLNLKKINEKNISIEYEIPESDYFIMDYEIAHSIFNNIFVFLTKSCSKNSNILFKSVQPSNNSTVIEIIANCSGNEESFYQNIDVRDLNNDLSFPIIFAIKFAELSGGKFKFSVDKTNTMIIELELPKELKF